MNQSAKKLDDLPVSSDDFWEGAEMMVSQPIRVDLCSTHDFIQIGAAASCTKCSYGTMLPGYMRVLNGSIVDLRDVMRD